MDILNLLKEDHQKVAHILEQLTDNTEDAIQSREKLFSQLEEEFLIHANFEEKIFYPTLKNEAPTQDLIEEAYEEHQQVKLLLKQLNEAAFDSEEWIEQLAEIKENIEHHVDEEENGLFPKAKKVLSKKTLAALAEQLKEFKAKNK